MPLIDSSYISPFWLRNGHLQSLWPVLLRPKARLPYLRQRLETADGDFIDLDLLPAVGTPESLCTAAPPLERRAVILSHGLEGNSQRAYMRGMASIFQQQGWDVIARNMRGCSGEPNRTRRMTHMGDTDDLHTTVLYACQQGYTCLVLIGFSMGGNQSLNYICESPARMPTAVRACVAVSVPCDLVSAQDVLALPSRRIYMEYFLRTLRKKMRFKAQQFADFPDTSSVDTMRTFAEFDGHFTAPVHGFSSALDYWSRASSAQRLHNVRIPTLLINAADDPFMTPSCFPYAQARANPHLYLEVPPHGGHVGFVTLHNHNVYWTEQRAVAFVQNVFGKGGGFWGGAAGPPLPEGG